ncbi:MAG: hypothetical protein AB1758_29860 [Candidatus Eremiobacterota bacterium]
MRSYAILAVLAVLLTAMASAQPKPPTRQDVERAIAAFEADPLGPGAKPHIATIVTFSIESDSVLVEMSPVTVPFIEDKNEKYLDPLLSAFIAGNVKAQLQAGKAEDRSVEGVREALRVYAMIRQRDPQYRSAGMDRLAEAESQGRLAAFIAEEKRKLQDKPAR